MKKTLSFLAVLLLSACASQQVPKSVIKFDLHGGTGSLSLPKDADIAGLDVSIGTNGTVNVKVQHLIVKTNPDVLQASGQATAMAITATGDVAAKTFAAGIQAAGKAFGPVP